MWLSEAPSCFDERHLQLAGSSVAGFMRLDVSMIGFGA